MAALTKAEMAEALFNQLGLNKREARELVDLFFEEVRAALSNGEQVKLSGFGNFDLRDKTNDPAGIQNGRRDSDQRPPRGDFPTGAETKGAGRSLCWSQRITTRSADPGQTLFTIGEVSDLCGVKPTCCAIGNKSSTAQTRETARQPPLLSATRRDRHPADPQFAV